MIVICTVCRTENGVRCPQCGCDASPIIPAHITARAKQSRILQPHYDPLYLCDSQRCLRNKNPFHKSEGGITHERHLRCPPTTRLELLQEPPEHKPTRVPGLTADQIAENTANQEAELLVLTQEGRDLREAQLLADDDHPITFAFTNFEDFFTNLEKAIAEARHKNETDK